MTPEYRINAETQIKSYLLRNDIAGIKNMQVERTFNDFDSEVHVWNVRTTNGNWWVVESEDLPMSLYTQNDFYFSADEAYSFHLGIIQRLNSRDQKNFSHIIAELPLDIDYVKSISRRLNKAATTLNDVKGPEDIQAIGLTCRESLIELTRVLAQENPDLIERNNLKVADFKGITKSIIEMYAHGSSNSKVRKHCRDVMEAAWGNSSEVVHSSNKNIPDAKICLLLTCTAVSLIQNLFFKYIGFDNEPKCPECKSLNFRISSTESSNAMVFNCNECNYKEDISVRE